MTIVGERYVKGPNDLGSIWRESVYQKDRFRCQSCGAKGGRLNAHHIYPAEKYPELKYRLWNGVTLCRKCHMRAHALHRLLEAGIISGKINERGLLTDVTLTTQDE